MTPEVTAVLAVVGAVGGAIGTVTGVWALIWQMSTRRRGADRVVLKVTAARIAPDGGEFSDDLVRVTAHNRGASGVTITGWGMKIIDRNDREVAALMTSNHPAEDRLPYRLEVGDDASFFVPVSALRDRASQLDVHPRRAQAWALLGTGQRITTDRGMPAI